MNDLYNCRCSECGVDFQSDILRSVCETCIPDKKEITALRAEVEKLRAALVTARSDLYNAANGFNDEDYRGPVPGGEGDFAAHSVVSQKRLVDWMCSRAEAISAALEEK